MRRQNVSDQQQNKHSQRVSFPLRTSFAGHLAGILVGLMYTQGPLKKMMEACAGGFSSNVGYPGQQYYFNSSGSSGYQDYDPHGRPGHYEEAPRNYDTYTAGLSEEEQLERALQASLWDRDSSERQMATITLWLSCEKIKQNCHPQPCTTQLGLLHSIFETMMAYTTKVLARE
ncbi:rhomboid-related protein 4 isoform X8 [Macaca fascicularis]|uniref:rhomboid-related protein 4 isoform X8 n=1 Tax=Macaca fascicularis TaxID=9541 RepID=UPI003D15DB7B